ncbi:hypothetical protein PLEOSDRAFT_1111965 [Pleurotus ostreatus PC15]|uniref:Uncharacterized protein n=1 Tax=Pleurotus ostreatus (strain PC15) TaxID=1137138 RepID=A0A067NXI8_PLEO1|nr:hypothetical protein PLEOSDRAFT_1111965 [Pleurotus ostreatus PC15]
MRPTRAGSPPSVPVLESTLNGPAPVFLQYQYPHLFSNSAKRSRKRMTSVMARTSSSSLRSSSAGDEGRQVSELVSTKPTKGRPVATSTPARVNASLEVGRNILQKLTQARASKKNAGGFNAVALTAVKERLNLPEVNEQVEKLMSSESTDNRDKIASTLAEMLEKDNAVFTEELEAYNLDLSVVIKQATESAESSPDLSRYLHKIPSETSADADSLDRSRQTSHNCPRPRSLSSSGKSDIFMSKNLESFAIDSGRQSRELKAALADRAHLSQLYQQAQNTLAEKKGLEASWVKEREAWEREREIWAKIEQRLEQLADGYKQDKADYKHDKEKLEKVHAEEKEKWETRYAVEIEKWEARHAVEIEKWETRYAEDKAEWQQQAKKWENRYENELQKREALEEELKALKERLRPSA